MKHYFTQQQDGDLRNTLHIEGDVGFGQAGEMKKCISKLTKEKTLKGQIHAINLMGLTSLDEAGMGMLLYVANKYAPEGRNTVFLNVPGGVQDMFKMSGFVAPVDTSHPKTVEFDAQQEDLRRAVAEFNQSEAVYEEIVDTCTASPLGRSFSQES